ncbi:MAG TPA: DUF4241 domain-containing protein [Actinocrinis sp.]
MSPRPPDFASLFAAGARHDFGRLRAGCVATVRIKQAATLQLPSGRLVACEPWSSFAEGAADCAFTQRVEPGGYPVELIIADFHDPGDPQDSARFSEVAGARVVVRGEPVAAWRMALQPGEDDSDLAQDGFFGYPVDGGTGSFCSPEFLEGVSTLEVGEELFEVVMDVVDADDVGLYVDEATGCNIVVFRSGGGDGHYGTWVGYTAAGEVACFVTDFLTLTGRDGEELSDDPGSDRPTAGTPGQSAPAEPLVSGTKSTAVRPTAKAAKGVPATPAGRRVPRSKPE